MIAGRAFGLFFLALGIPITTLLIYWLPTATKLPHIVILGPCFTALGLAMVLLPGDREITFSSDVDMNETFSLIWPNAPVLHKISWVVSCIGILFCTFYVLTEASVVPL